MGKITTSDTKTKQRHNPLLKDISSQGGNLRTVPRSSSSSSQRRNHQRNKDITMKTTKKMVVVKDF